MPHRALLPLLSNPADILREHHEVEARILAEAEPTALRLVADSRPVVLDQYVRDTFNGVIGDAPLPFVTQDDARLAIEAQLTARAGRPLYKAELTIIGIEVAIEWNRRVAAAQPAKLAAFRVTREMAVAEDLADQRDMHREEHFREHGAYPESDE